MRLGLRRELLVATLVGGLMGWAGSRLVLPVPSVIHVSPVTNCGTGHEVVVPMAENVSWAVQTGGRFWNPRAGTWSREPAWHAGPGKVVVPKAPEGVRLVVKGFASGQIAGASIKAIP
jgi:hypothetical protein